MARAETTQRADLCDQRACFVEESNVTNDHTVRIAFQYPMTVDASGGPMIDPNALDAHGEKGSRDSLGLCIVESSSERLETRVQDGWMKGMSVLQPQFFMWLDVR
jgi:hypothetical protein